MNTYSSIEELTLTLALYPTQKEAILEEAGKKFKVNGQDAFFIVAEDGNCALFNKNYELDDLSKIIVLKEEMISKDIKKINISDGIISIGELAFAGCESLMSINIPDSVKSIEENAFDNCVSLTSITIPDSVKSIGDNAFYNCESLESVNIPDSVESIGDNAFNNCVSLTSITIPNSVESIGEWAFFSCESLKSINIPDSVESIGDWAFFGCESLKEVIFKGKTLEEVESMNFYPWGVNGVNDESIIKAEF